jgi:hypothetical protein
MGKKDIPEPTELEKLKRDKIVLMRLIQYYGHYNKRINQQIEIYKERLKKVEDGIKRKA